MMLDLWTLLYDLVGFSITHSFCCVRTNEMKYWYSIKHIAAHFICFTLIKKHWNIITYIVIENRYWFCDMQAILLFRTILFYYARLILLFATILLLFSSKFPPYTIIRYYTVIWHRRVVTSSSLVIRSMFI